MGNHNIDPNTGLVKFTPTKEEKNQLDLRRDIKHIKEEMQEIKKLLETIISML